MSRIGAISSQSARVIWCAAEGTVQVAARISYLNSSPIILGRGTMRLEAVAEGLVPFGGEMGGGIDAAKKASDAVTADILSEVVRAADQALWSLEAHREPA